MQHSPGRKDDAPEVDQVFADPAFAVLKARGAAFTILRAESGEVLWANAPAASFWAAPDAEALATALFGAGRAGGGWLDGLATGLVPGRPPRLVRSGLGRGFRMRAHTALIAAVPGSGGGLLIGVAAPESAGVLPADPEAWRRPAWRREASLVVSEPVQDIAIPPSDDAAERSAPAPPDAMAGAALARRSQIAVLRDRLNQALDGVAMLRLVWRTDASETVTQIDAASFARLASPLHFADGPLPDLLSPYDPDGATRLREVLASRATWSGLTVALPVAEGAARVPMTLGAAPVFGPERRFAGFRGFGTIDLARLDLAPPPVPVAAAPTVREPVVAVADPRGPDEASPEGERSGPTETPLLVAAPDPVVLLPSPANVVHLRAFQAMMANRSAPAAESPPSVAVAPSATLCGVQDGEAVGPVSDTGADEPGEAESTKVEADLASSDDLAFLALREALRARIGGLSPSVGAEAATARPEPEVPVPAAGPVPAVEIRESALPAAARLLDLLPLGVVVVADRVPVFANVAAAARFGAASPAALLATGRPLPPADEARHIDIVWDEAPATLLILDGPAHPAVEAPWPDPASQSPAEEGRAGELLDRIDDAVALLDGTGLVRRLNRRGESWFGAAGALGRSFTDLLAPESRPVALALLGEVRGQRDGSGQPPPRRDVLARTGEAATMPMVLTLGRLGDTGFYLILRDVTALKRAETERDRTERDHARDADRLPQLLGRVSHEIRTPLNAILGFAEVMMDERFGPLGNPRYRDYLKDIHASGTQVMALVEDLLDLSRIEAGQIDLAVAAVDINRIVTETVAQMQPDAHRERVIMRTSLGGRIPPVLADERSARQIVRNLLSNAVKFNEPGGQVIVSTAVGDDGAVLLRVRDTGVGMTDTEIAAALEPFGGASSPVQGNGLGLPVTRALVGANGASMAIRSRPREGTLVEVAFVPVGPAAETRRPA